VAREFCGRRKDYPLLYYSFTLPIDNWCTFLSMSAIGYTPMPSREKLPSS
jgi:hypothetical protein